MAELLDDSSDQQTIQEMLDKLYPILNDPSQKYNLSSFIKNNGYDPYNISNQWTWSMSDSNAMQLVSTACGDIADNANTYPCASSNDYYIANPASTPQLILSSIQIQGMSAVQSERPTVASDAVTITQVMDFSTISPYTPLTVTGNFTLNLNCCCSADQSTCLANTAAPYQGLGTFKAIIPNPKYPPPVGQPSCSMTIVFKITQLSPGVLTLVAQSVVLTVPGMPNNKNMPNIDVSISITSAGNQKTFNNLAQELFNSQQSLDTILTNANNELGSQVELAQFSKLVTGEVDDYLKGNNLYPFNNSSLSVV